MNETPVKSRKGLEPTTPLMQEQSELSPSGSPYYQVKYRDYESAINAIQQLESELQEFQSSSAELEKELELELNNLDKENESLKEEVEILKLEIDELKLDRAEYEKRINQENHKMISQIKSLERDLEMKNSKLVDIEIKNDDIEQNERNLNANYRDLEEEYNKSLEKVIILENELSDASSKLIKEQLDHQNTKNELKLLKDSTVLHPLSSSLVNENHLPRMTKSSSIRQLHNMIEQTKDMENRIGSLKDAFNSKSYYKYPRKSATTTKITNTVITTTTIPMSKHGTEKVYSKIPMSPSSYKLSSLARNEGFVGPLEKIEGSPAIANKVKDTKVEK